MNMIWWLTCDHSLFKTTSHFDKMFAWWRTNTETLQHNKSLCKLDSVPGLFSQCYRIYIKMFINICWTSLPLSKTGGQSVSSQQIRQLWTILGPPAALDMDRMSWLVRSDVRHPDDDFLFQVESGGLFAWFTNISTDYYLILLFIYDILMPVKQSVSNTSLFCFVFRLVHNNQSNIDDILISNSILILLHERTYLFGNSQDKVRSIPSF